MISEFKPKAPKILGIDFSSPAAQAADVAKMIGATSFSVDIYAGTATFVVGAASEDPLMKYVVNVGEVISVKDGIIEIQGRDDFYRGYEQY